MKKMEKKTKRKLERRKKIKKNHVGHRVHSDNRWTYVINFGISEKVPKSNQHHVVTPKRNYPSRKKRRFN